MSFSATELQQHCQVIMQSRRIKNKMVILCEGGNMDVLKGRPSASAYRQLEKLPDANFYSACVPTWWTAAKPEFFVCGDKENVLKTYFELRKLHTQQRTDSYLNKEKLFAIIDLDLHPPHRFENYLLKDTEELFKSLYQQNIPQLENIQHNPIFITGFIYKEAYFLVPALQSVFDNEPHPVMFHDTPLCLNTLYQIMLNNLANDKNLCLHLQIAANRLDYLKSLDFTTITTFQQSWLNSFHIANDSEKIHLIYALLTIHQVKQYWKQIKSQHLAITEERFKEQLTLSIAQFYAKQPRNSPSHVVGFFNALATHK